MSTKKVTRKIISRSSLPKKEVTSHQEPIVKESAKVTRSKRECFFCQNKSNPSYTDLASLRRFLTDRAKIAGKERTGACSKHQRVITRNIKYARHLSLLPFVPKV